MSNNNQYQVISDYQAIRVSGADSAKFLQGQLTCDLADADGNKAVIGGYCNVQGRLHATFYLLQSADDYLMICPKGVAEHLVSTLAKYAVFFQTELQIDENLTLVAQTNTEKKEHLSQTCTPTGEQFALGDLVISISRPETLNIDTAESELDMFALEQIRHNIPMVTSETIETLLPHYIGLPQIGGVNFEKGCYTGQEVVARMHYRGTLKTHPHKVQIDSEELIDAGSEVMNTDGKKVGELINPAFDGEKLIGLISLADKALEASLEIDGKAVKRLDAEN